MTDAVPDDMNVEQWDAQYFEDFRNTDWFTKFSGTSKNAMIHEKETLVDRPGQTVHLTLVNELTGEALGENDMYEGNEGNVVMRDFSVTIHEYGKPVKYKNFEQQKTPIQLRKVYKDGLMNWNKSLHRDKVIGALCDFYGNDGVTKGMFARKHVAAASETIRDEWLGLNTDRVLFGSRLDNRSGTDHSASLGNIDGTNDKLSTNMISLAKYMATHPAAGRPKVRPLMPRKTIDESHGFVMFTNSLGIRDLEQDPAFLQANREARARGIDNPIFKAANYIWKNVAIYDIEEMPTLTGVGADSIDVGVSKLMGAQALGVAWAKRPWTKDKELDYGRFEGMAIMQWYEVEKLRWGTGEDDKDQPCDHGMVTVYHSAVPYQ